MSEKAPTNDHKSRGRFCWHDLMTTDVERATTYYGALLGWTFERSDPKYTIFLDGTQPGHAGGMMALGDRKMPPHWMPYVTVADLETALESVKALGGELVFGPFAVEDVGTMATIADNQGAMIDIIELVEDAPATSLPQAGQFCWYTLAVPDPDASATFYTKLFGWSVEDGLPGDGTQMKLFARRGMPLAGIFAIPPGAPIPPNWTCSVAVADIEAIRAKVGELGGQVIMGPTPVGAMGTTMLTHDDQGAHLGYFEPNLEDARFG